MVSGSLSVTHPLSINPLPPVQACNGCNFLLTWGSYGSLNGQFYDPTGVAVDSAGNVYVADFDNYRVEKFTGTGTYVTAWGCVTAGTGCPGGSGPGNFESPQFIAVDSAGNVYVTDSNNNRVEKFTGTGAYVTAWGCVTAGTGCSTGSGNGQFNYPVGVAVDSSGNVYVVDGGNDRVEKFTSTGAFLTSWTGSGAETLSGPAGVAVDSFGNVYVADSGNNRVELFGDSALAAITLFAGWNLISLPVIPLSSAMGYVLAGLIVGGNFTIVWSYQAGKWLSATCCSGGKVKPGSPPLTTMQDGFGYWIYVTTPSTLNVLGYVIALPPSIPPSYSLSAGWNLVGFKPQPDPTLSVSVSVYLTSVSGDYNVNSVWIYDNPSGTWIRTTGSTPIPVGEALWVYMTTPATLRP